MVSLLGEEISEYVELEVANYRNDELIADNEYKLHLLFENRRHAKELLAELHAKA